MTIPKQPIFDVCVIGSGPAGGVLSKELAEAGAKVVLVEAGRKMTAKDFLYHTWPYEMPLRGVNEEANQPAAAFPSDLIKAVRYENSDQVGLGRVRAVGGRSIHWTGVCLRFAEDDFRERSAQGVEDDWPITYNELAPYYSYVEKMIGVTGTRENLPIVPDGEYLPPLKFRCSEKILKRACGKMNIPMIPARKALLTVPHDNRPACHYCGHCDTGCDVGAIFSVPVSMLPKAEKTGNFTLLENKLAREILVDTEGRVRAVSVIDTMSRREEEIHARIFVVSCGNAETARLLLNSKSHRFPNGVANSNDIVGRYLTGHITHGVRGYLEDLVGTAPVNNDGAEDHSYIPRFKLGARKPDYAGGFQIQVQHTWFMLPYHAHAVKGFGESFKKQVRELQPGYCFLGCFGKVLAKYENRITVDSSRKDSFGIPIPVVRFRFSDNDLALWRDMTKTSAEILDGAKVRLMVQGNSRPSGFASHDVGTVRMGHDPKMSVLNSFCQTHEVKNLFVVDGSCFTTSPEKNPTLTIMALAVRTARYMAEAIRKGDL